MNYFNYKSKIKNMQINYKIMNKLKHNYNKQQTIMKLRNLLINFNSNHIYIFQGLGFREGVGVEKVE